LDRVEIRNTDIGLDWKLIDDNFVAMPNGRQATSTEEILLSQVDISNSRFNTKLSDIKTQTFVLEDFELINYEEIIPETATSTATSTLEIIDYNTLITSSYNMYIGRGYSFDLALGSKLSTSHDNYSQVNGGQSLVLDDFNRQVAQYDDLWLLQNNGKDVISVNGAGNILMSPQNVLLDSFLMSEDISSTTLTVVANEEEEAARFYGALTIGPGLIDSSTASSTATSTGQVAGISELKFLSDAQISASGTSTLKVGLAGNTVDLNVVGVEYILPEDAVRDNITAYIDQPKEDIHIWGSGENSWKPSSDIRIQKIKAQYNCGTNGKVDLRLEDDQDQVLAEIVGVSCVDDFINIESEDLSIDLSSEQGMHIVVSDVTGGYQETTVLEDGGVITGNFVGAPSQLTITLEYVYR